MVLFFVGDTHEVMSYDCGHSCHLSFAIAGTDTTVTSEVLFWIFIWNLKMNFGLFPGLVGKCSQSLKNWSHMGCFLLAQIVVHCKNQMQLLFYMSDQIWKFGSIVIILKSFQIYFIFITVLERWTHHHIILHWCDVDDRVLRLHFRIERSWSEIQIETFPGPLKIKRV